MKRNFIILIFFCGLLVISSPVMQIDVHTDNSDFQYKTAEESLTEKDSTFRQKFDIENKKLNSFNTITTNDYEIGDTDQFWVLDIQKASNNVDDDGDGRDYNENDWDEAIYELTGVVVFKTSHLYIIVDKNLEFYYQNGIAEGIAFEFENQIYSRMIPALGRPTDNDQNERIVVLIYEIRENTSSGLFTTGFFWPIHQYVTSTNPEDVEYYSEFKEIININHRLVLKGIDDIMPTIAHEFFHLIHFDGDQTEDIWLEEGLAVFAEHFSGYQAGYLEYLVNNQDQTGFFQQSDLSLTYWDYSLNHYGASFLFVLYFSQRFGLDGIKLLIQSSKHGMESVESVLIQLTNKTDLLHNLYRDWSITNFLNQKNFKFYYYNNLTESIDKYSSVTSLSSLPSFLINQSLNYWSSQYYLLPDGHSSNFQISFLPEHITDEGQFQLTILEQDEVTNLWYVKSIPFYNNYSAFSMIRTNNTISRRVLIVSSLVGDSSGNEEIITKEQSSSNFHLFLNKSDYEVISGIGNYNFETKIVSLTGIFLQSLEGTLIDYNLIDKTSFQVFNWIDNKELTKFQGELIFSLTQETWSVPENIFTKLPASQYYFIYEFQLKNGAIIKGYGPVLIIFDKEDYNVFPTIDVSLVISSLLLSYVIVRKKRTQFL